MLRDMNRHEFRWVGKISSGSEPSELFLDR